MPALVRSLIYCASTVKDAAAKNQPHRKRVSNI
jgi:hypothetical protein